MATNIRALLNSEELARVTRKNDLRAAGIVLSDWSMVIGLFALAAAFPNPVTILFTVLLLGGRQMAFGVLVHETGHQSFFTSRRANDFVATWLSGYWVFSDKDAYMKGHLMHHKDCGTVDDPDLKNFDAYPVSRTGFKRKVLRDITGKIGWRRVVSIGRSFYRFNQLKPGLRKMLVGGVICNTTLFLALYLAGSPGLYALWVIAFMTSHMLITRVRQIAEHAAVPDHLDTDIRLNTRTLYINWLEALLVAPHGLNFHLEHHLMASVPIYRLKELHHILLDKGYYDGIEFPKGYLGLLRKVTYGT